MPVKSTKSTKNVKEEQEEQVEKKVEKKPVKKVEKEEKEEKKPVKKVEKKETKEKKEKTEKKEKNDKKDDEDKEPKKNKATMKVGLELNVNPFKKWLKTFYTNGDDTKKILNAHYILATVNEVMLFNILTGVSDKFSKSKNGLEDLTSDRFVSYLRETDYLSATFAHDLTKYNADFDYSKQLPVTQKELNEFIEKKCFHNNGNVSINKETLNLVFYLLAVTNSKLASYAGVFAKFAKKTTITGDGMSAAVEVLFTSKLLVNLQKKMNEVQTILKNKPKKDSDKNDNEDDNDDEEEGEDENEEEEEENEEEENEEEDDE